MCLPDFDELSSTFVKVVVKNILAYLFETRFSQIAVVVANIGYRNSHFFEVILKNN